MSLRILGHLSLIVGGMLLINKVLGLRIFLRVDLSDCRHCLFLIAKMNAKLDRFFLENKEVE
jgi:hypothetical protein